MPVIEAYVKATITTPGEPPTKATQVDVILLLLLFLLLLPLLLQL